MSINGIGDEYIREFTEIWNTSYSVDNFLERFPRKMARRSALSTASLLRKGGIELKAMVRGAKAPNTKDGRTLNGHRLGHATEAMYQRIAAYAERYGYKSVNDAVMVLIDLSLTEDEEGIEYQPPRSPHSLRLTRNKKSRPNRWSRLTTSM